MCGPPHVQGRKETGSNTNRLQLYEPVDNIGVWLHTPDAEIEVMVTVTDLRVWHNYFVIREFFDFWSEYTHTNPWEDCFYKSIDPPLHVLGVVTLV